ncbi:hypothetical protein KW805_02755 [Candidatus Pacearchaeota archaeon]|nr:hypothetical protein [Candidatus Pacearchaeota archaeon]
MRDSEFAHIIAAVIILTLVISFSALIGGDFALIPQLFLFAVIIIATALLAKKIMAYILDADVEHRLWMMDRYGWKAHQHFKREVPAGIIIPLFLTLFSLGTVKFMGILTYEARALKVRAAKRFGPYSYTEMTDWHNGLIGAAGVVAVLVLAMVIYLVPANLELLAKMAVFYALSNMIPFSKLDGTQIFFGSRVLWTALAVITLIFTTYAFVLP